MRLRIVFIPALLLLAAGAEPPATIQWSATATGGQSVSVPDPARVSVVAFVRPDQAHSNTVIGQIRSTLSSRADAATTVLVVLVVSGKNDVAGIKCDWPVVHDPEFAASGKFGVHVWPTTVVVGTTGSQVAHLAGAPASFASDLPAYVDFAAGRIDDAALKSRLADRAVVDDGTEQKAERRLLLAAQLVDRGQLDAARQQLDEALAQRPGDPKLTALLARTLLLQQKAADALALLDKLPAGGLPGWQLQQLRASAFVQLDRWDDAQLAVTEALKLNPNPAEALYLSGLILQHDSQWQPAAEAFRKAYESSQESRKHP